MSINTLPIQTVRHILRMRLDSLLEHFSSLYLRNTIRLRVTKSNRLLSNRTTSFSAPFDVTLHSSTLISCAIVTIHQIVTILYSHLNKRVRRHSQLLYQTFAISLVVDYLKVMLIYLLLKIVHYLRQHLFQHIWQLQHTQLIFQLLTRNNNRST